MKPTIIITGHAGFIGSHAVEAFLRLGWNVVGIDNFCGSDLLVNLKKNRIRTLRGRLPDLCESFVNLKANICDQKTIQLFFSLFKPSVVLHLAAQAGVRDSIDNPFIYQESNVDGFLKILECCRNCPSGAPRLIYASSSSVYGGNKSLPFRETDRVDEPQSLYAATKRADELFACTYSHLYGIQTIGLRFFTVYGDWYRPDMAMSLFADALVGHRPIKVFNNGNMMRDFTFVDDIIDGIERIAECQKLPLCDIFNIGSGKGEKLLDMIDVLASALHEQPILEFLPMQKGDVVATHASIEKISATVGYAPSTSIEKGIPVFAKWYKEYHGIH